MGSETLPSACYILSDESIPFYSTSNGYKHQRYDLLKFIFPIILMGAIRYSCPTYILPAKERRLLGKFQPDSPKTEGLVCVETD